MNDAAKDETTEPATEEVDLREERVSKFCEIACGHLADSGCHDPVAKMVIEAIAKTMAGGLGE